MNFREHTDKIIMQKFPKRGVPMSNIELIQSLINEKAEAEARLNLIPYDGSPEVKENSSGKYLYIRKRVGSRLTSTYVDIYSDDLYQLLLKNARESRELKKNIRRISKQLAELGYTSNTLAPDILLNLDFARANMKTSIYDQAVLEGVSTTFPQTEDIIENGTVNGMTASDVQKILNLKHAWEFILDEGVLQAYSDYYLLCHIAKLINEGFYHDGGRIRGVPVTIGGCKYIPPIPIESIVKEKIRAIFEENDEEIDKAVNILLYSMKTQIFIDGNKRAAVIFANHYMISHGLGILVIPEKEVPEFKKLLVKYYEDDDKKEISVFLRSKCWKKMKDE